MPKQQIQKFDEWKISPKGNEACDLAAFPSLPKKHIPFVLARIEQAYKDGVQAVLDTMEKEELVLTPPVEPTE